MKNKKLQAIIIALFAFICVVGAVKAYEVKMGDSLSKIARNANMSLADIVALNPEITNPNLIYPGQIINTYTEDNSLFLEDVKLNNSLQLIIGVPQITFTPVALTLGAGTPFRPSEFKTTLASQLTEGHSGTTLKVNSITTKDGNTLDGSVLGDVIVLHINPGRANAEIVKCTGLTTATKTFTGCTFGYRFDTNSTDADNIKSHSQGETVIISDDDLYLTTQYPTIVGANTFTGANYFASSTSEVAKMYLTTSTQIYLWANKSTGQFGFATSSTEYAFNVGGTTFNPNLPLTLTSGELKIATSTNDFVLTTGLLTIRKNNSITSNDGGLAVATTTDFVWTGKHTFTTATVTTNNIIGASNWSAPTNTLTVVGSVYATGNATTSGQFVVGVPTGGGQGVGSVAAQSFYENGLRVSPRLVTYTHSENSLSVGGYETSIATTTVPAGLMGANGMLKITAVGYKNDSDNALIQIRLDKKNGSIGTSCYETSIALDLGGVEKAWRYECVMSNRGATNSQILSAMAWEDDFLEINNATSTASVDTTAAFNVVLTGASGGSGQTIYVEDFWVELIR